MCAWIESHQEIGRHPKVKKLARLLGIGIPQTVGHLHLLWHWCLDYAKDGNLSKHDEFEIADAAMWEKDADKFLQALYQSEFIDKFGEEFHVHDWIDYGGRLIAMRAANVEKQRQWREDQKLLLGRKPKLKSM